MDFLALVDIFANLFLILFQNCSLTKLFGTRPAPTSLYMDNLKTTTNFIGTRAFLGLIRDTLKKMYRKKHWKQCRQHRNVATLPRMRPAVIDHVRTAEQGEHDGIKEFFWSGLVSNGVDMTPEWLFSFVQQGVIIWQKSQDLRVILEGQHLRNIDGIRYKGKVFVDVTYFLNNAAEKSHCFFLLLDDDIHLERWARYITEFSQDDVKCT